MTEEEWAAERVIRALRNIRIRHTASVTENPRLTRGPEMIAGAAEIGLQTTHWRRQKFRRDSDA
jgi:hypothetical protein